MEIILKEDIIGLGYKNDIVNVKSGYGRNYLIPQGKGVIASPMAKKILAENLKQQAHKLAAIKAEAEKKKLEFTNHLASAKEYLAEEDAKANLKAIQETGYFSDLQIYMKEDNKAFKIDERDTL